MPAYVAKRSRVRSLNHSHKFRISYNQEKLMLNEAFRQEFMNNVGFIGTHIEQIYEDEPQDIEGAFVNG